MSIRSAFSALGRTIAAALKGAGRAAVWTTKKVFDAATGTMRTVFELITPAVPALPAQDAAEAYLDAVAVETAPMRIRSTEEVLASAEAHVNPPLGKAVKAWAAHRYWGSEAGGEVYSDVDISEWPENLQIWLHGLSRDDLGRVAHAPASRLDMHVRAQCEPDLMPGLRPVLSIPAARAEVEARREAVIRDLADGAGVRMPGHRREEAFKSDIDVLAELAAAEGPTPISFR